MRVDEFRRELADLAGQIPPYGNDVRDVRRTLARRRLVTASVVVVVLALTAVGTIALTRTTRRHVDIIAPHPSKQVTPSQLQLSGGDALIVIGTDAGPDSPTRTQQALERSDEVDRYTKLPWGVDPTVSAGVLAQTLQFVQQQLAQQSGSSNPGLPMLPGSILSMNEKTLSDPNPRNECSALPANRTGFVAQLAPTPGAAANLRAALGSPVSVYSLGAYRAPNAELLANVLGGLRSTCPTSPVRGHIGNEPWTLSVSPPKFPFPRHPTPGPEPGSVNAPLMTLDYRGEHFSNGPDCSLCPIAWVFADTAKDGQRFIYGAVPEVVTDVTTTEPGAGPRTTSAEGDGADDHWKFFVVPLGTVRHDVIITFLATGSVAGTTTFGATDVAIGASIH